MALLRVPSGLPLCVLLISTLSGLSCGRVPGQFTIINNQVPLPGCLIPTNRTIYQGQGFLDLSLVQDGADSAFLVFPLLENNLPASTGGIDPNRISLRSFAIDISPISSSGQMTTDLFTTLSNNGDPLVRYQVPWSGSVDSGGGMVAAAVHAFPVQLAQRLLDTQEIGVSPSLTVNLRIRAFGRTTTQDIESDPFDYPVSVCAGCLIANVAACPYTTPPANLGNDCNIAQDGFVDCCTSGGDLICPPVVAQ
jgi:hypothetical protein